MKSRGGSRRAELATLAGLLVTVALGVAFVVEGNAAAGLILLVLGPLLSALIVALIWGSHRLMGSTGSDLEDQPNDVSTWVRTRRPIKWLLTRGSWLMGIVVGAVCFLVINGTTGNLLGAGVVANYRLLTDRQHTAATVTGIGMPHYACSYTYHVAGRTFSQVETGCGGSRVGSTLTINYVPNHPEDASFGDPTSEFRDTLLGNYGVPLGFGVFMYVAWKLSWKSRYPELFRQTEPHS